jgi:hypothetical protein
MHLRIALAEKIVDDFAVVFSATAMIKFGLSQVMINASNHGKGATHLQII